LDAVIPNGNEPHFGKALDMEMLLMLSPAKVLTLCSNSLVLTYRFLTVPNQQERTEAEFGELLKRAGFKLAHVTPNPISIGVVVGEPDE